MVKFPDGAAALRSGCRIRRQDLGFGSSACCAVRTGDVLRLGADHRMGKSIRSDVDA